MLQVQTLVNMVGAASIPKALFSVSVCRGMKDLVARWMSMNACLILAIMMPPAWIKLGGSTAYVCQVSALIISFGKGKGRMTI